MNLLTEQKESQRLRIQTYGSWREGTVREFGKYTVIFKMDNQQGPIV